MRQKNKLVETTWFLTRLEYCFVIVYPFVYSVDLDLVFPSLVGMAETYVYWMQPLAEACSGYLQLGATTFQDL
jgi:hypothetical protein